MKHFSMMNQKAMAADITYPFGRRFASREYWENANQEKDSHVYDEYDYADSQYRA